MYTNCQTFARFFYDSLNVSHIYKDLEPDSVKQVFFYLKGNTDIKYSIENFAFT